MSPAAGERRKRLAELAQRWIELGPLIYRPPTGDPTPDWGGEALARLVRALFMTGQDATLSVLAAHMRSWLTRLPAWELHHALALSGRHPTDAASARRVFASLIEARSLLESRPELLAAHAHAHACIEVELAEEIQALPASERAARRSDLDARLGAVIRKLTGPGSVPDADNTLLALRAQSALAALARAPSTR